MGIKVKCKGFTGGKFGVFGKKHKTSMRRNGDIFEIDGMDEFSEKHMVLLDGKPPEVVEPVKVKRSKYSQTFTEPTEEKF